MIKDLICKQTLKMKLRTFISWLLLWTFVIVLISGIALHIAPGTNIAQKINWTWLGLNKPQWIRIHTLIGFIFSGAIAIHLYLNLNALICYIKSKAKRGLAHYDTFIVSLIITIILVVIAINKG